MKNFEQLYCLDKKGKIRTFKLRVEEDDFTTSTNDLLGVVPFDLLGATIISETGLLNGKLISKATKVSKGKNLGKANETTPYEQAVFQAESKWNDKLDEGYKSDAMCIERTAGLTFSEMVDRGQLRVNTSSNWDELPMLAEPIKKVKTIKFPAYIQPKLNGVRCLSKNTSEDPLLMSRGGKYYNIPHIQEALKKVFTAWGKTVILDGEIFNKDYTLQDIVGASVEKAGEKDKSFLEYHIYDLAMSLSQRERLDMRNSILEVTNPDVCLKIVPTYVVNSMEEIEQYHAQFVSDGYEGSIIRIKHGKYHFGFRDKDLMKKKDFMEEEFELLGCKVTEGKSIGESFVFALRNNINNLTFYARPRGTVTQKEKWYQDESWIGSKATVRYQERTPDGLPHQAHVVIIRDYE